MASTRPSSRRISDGCQADGASITAVQAALLDAGAVPLLIAPRLGTVATADGVELEANGSLENSSPVLFDALAMTKPGIRG